MLGLILGTGCAYAQTDEIELYDGKIAAPRDFNLTLHDNYAPLGRKPPDHRGAFIPNHTLNGVPEWAYGVADWLEIGTDLPPYSLDGLGRTYINGVKLRALFVAPHAKVREWFYGVNFELSCDARHWEQTRFSGEVRPIIGTHVGPWDFVFNSVNVPAAYQHLRALRGGEA